MTFDCGIPTFVIFFWRKPCVSQMAKLILLKFRILSILETNFKIITQLNFEKNICYTYSEN